MKVLLIGNYANARQQSMQRFAELMLQCLSESGHEVRLSRPAVVLGRLLPGETGLAKWIGYLDRFLLFPPLLYKQLKWADVVHICDQANAVYIPRLCGKPHVLTCHDMLAIRAALGEIRESSTGWTGRKYQRWILRNMRKAQSVACVSQQTHDDVVRIAGLESPRLAIVPNALNYPYRPMERPLALQRLSALGLEDGRPFFFHVGGNQWYKNRGGVLRIFAKLIEMPAYRAHILVMAGKPWTAETRQLAQDLGLNDRVVELVGVENEDLRALYSTADALIFPSLFEGFGWPIAEAQACGCPVATSDRSPMTEVAGDGAIYIDPTDDVRAAKAIAKGLSSRERLRLYGLRNAARFSIEAMISSYIELYRTAMNERPDLPPEQPAEPCAADVEGANLRGSVDA